MTTTTVTGTNGVAETFTIYPQTWSGGTITGYEDYDIVNFELGVDTLDIPFNGGFASLSTVADFQQAIYDIEATGNLGWSAIGTSYEVDGNDIVFSWDGQGQIRLEGLASSFETDVEQITYTQPGDGGTSQTDNIVIDRDTAWEGAVLDTGFGDDTVTLESGGLPGWVSISNSGGSDTIDVSGLGEFEQAFIWGADDANESDNVTTGAGDDVIFTYAGDDVINSGDGDDQVVAGQGNDTVDMGAGVDSFIFQGGNDVVTGGANRDTYEINQNTGGTITITDLKLTNGSQGGTGEDVLELVGLGTFTQRQDLLAQDTFSNVDFADVGGDLVMTFGDTTVVMEDVGFWL